MKILCAVGARPNFPKIAGLKEVFKEHDYRVIHMGQHSSEEMSGIFLKQLRITPDYFVSDLEGAQKVLNDFSPEVLIVVGDVNSARDACILGKRMGVVIAHLEAGLRSFDHSMPEEINRILIDSMADIHWATEESGLINLKKEGKTGVLIENPMLATARFFSEEIEAITIPYSNYILFTSHRPSNVDGEEINRIEALLQQLSEKYTVIFPIHPRTKTNDVGSTICIPPQDYFTFHKLMKEAKLVLTDSGGVQEETTFYGVPCLTLRDNTERPSTLKGTNRLVGKDIKNILKEVDLCLKSK